METFETLIERGCGLDVHKATVLSNKYFFTSSLAARAAGPRQSRADPKLSQRLLCGYWYLPGKTFLCPPIDFEKKITSIIGKITVIPKAAFG